MTGRDPLLDTAIALHEHAMKDEYFKSRNLYPVSLRLSLIEVPC